MKRKLSKSSVSTGVIPSPGELNEPSDVLTDYSIGLYGIKGIGKTSLCASFPGFLVVETEPFRKNLRIFMVELYVGTFEEIESGEATDAWKKFKQVTEEAAARDDIKGIAVDSIDRLYDACLTSHCMEENVRHPGAMKDFGYLWSVIRDDFEATLNRWKRTGKGLILTSHASKQDMEMATGKNVAVYSPTCSTQAERYLRVCDYQFFYGYHGNGRRQRRCIHLRGFDNLQLGCGPQDRFMTPDGEPLRLIEMPDDPMEGYATLVQGFNNELYNPAFMKDTPDEQDDKPSRKRS